MATFSTFSEEKRPEYFRDGATLFRYGTPPTPGGMEPSDNTLTRTSPNVSQYRAEAQQHERRMAAQDRNNYYRNPLGTQQQAQYQSQSQTQPQTQQPRQPALVSAPNSHADAWNARMEAAPRYGDDIFGRRNRRFDKMMGDYEGENMSGYPGAPQPQQPQQPQQQQPQQPQQPQQQQTQQQPALVLAPNSHADAWNARNQSPVQYANPPTVNSSQPVVPYGSQAPQQRWGDSNDLQQQYEANLAEYAQRQTKRFMDPIMRPFEAGFMPGFLSNYQN